MFNSTRDRDEFKPHIAEIEDNPVSPLGRAVLWIILAFTTLTILWLFLAKTDVVVSAKAEAIPDGDILTLQPLQVGSIKKIYAKVGDFIKKDQPLIEIDSTVEMSNIESKQKNYLLTDLEVKKIKFLIRNEKFTIATDVPFEVKRTLDGMYTNEKGMLDNDRQRIEEQINQTKEEIEVEKVDKYRLQKLTEVAREEVNRLDKVKHLIAHDQLNIVKREYLDHREELNKKGYMLRRLHQRIQELKREKALSEKTFYNQLYIDLSIKEKELSVLKAEVSQFEFQKSKQVISADCDGIISKMFVNTIGGVVSPGEELVTVVPNNTPIKFKATVPSAEIGYIHEGMEVAMKIDTFSYQRYGTLTGIVTHISASAINQGISSTPNDGETSSNTSPTAGGLVYEVFIEPMQDYLIVDGVKRKIFAGITATAEIKVEERRVIDFFMAPLIKGYDDGISVI
jgi:hemolysin D